MKKYTLLLALLIIGHVGYAQNGSGSYGFNIKAYVPKAEFNRNVNKTPIGLSFNYLRSYTDSKWSWGGDFGVAMYSSDEYSLEYNGRTLEIHEEDCFFSLHGFVRYNFYERKGLKTYAEGRIGVTTFFSTTEAVEEDTGFEGEFDFHGTAFNLGIGAGVLINTSTFLRPENDPGSVWINLGFNAHSGSNATYRMLPEGNSTHSLEDGQFTSLTHYFGFKAGVAFSLD